MYITKRDEKSLILVVRKFTKFGIWKCKACNNIAVATVHQRRRTYCSKTCEAVDYKVILKGKNNPNFKNAGVKTCENCFSKFKSYNNKSKFCSNTCYSKSRIIIDEKPCFACGVVFKPHSKITKFCSKKCSTDATRKPKPPKIKKISTKITILCESCGKSLSVYKSSNRKYCSYQCHLNNGGAKKAGDAAAMAKMKYGVKKDANHNEVFEVIKLITAVHDLSSAGFGVPDGCAWCGDKGWQFFDVKNPNTGYGRRGLNPVQKKWASDWRGGPVYLIYNIDEAQRFSRGDFDGIKKFPED